MSPSRDLPSGPPFTVRARVVSPLAAGGTLDLADGLVEVDAGGRIAAVESASDVLAEQRDAAIDLRPWVVLPGMIDLHAHLPQVPNAGLGFALPLLDWLDRLTFPTERSWADPTVAARRGETRALVPATLKTGRGQVKFTNLAIAAGFAAALSVSAASAADIFHDNGLTEVPPYGVDSVSDPHIGASA